MNRRRGLILLLDVLLTVVVFNVSHRLFRESKGLPQLCDSTYCLLAAESILTTGSADLSSHVPADPETRRRMHGYAPHSDLPYQFVRTGSPPAVYYGYPPGSTFLSMPFLQRYLNRGLSTVRSDGQPNLDVESVLQHRIASNVAAAATALFYILARFFCSPIVAALLALGFGLGSPVWSTLSRSLWSHTWMVFWLSTAILLLVISTRRTVRSWPTSLLLGLGLGTSLFAMVVTRPHAVLSAGPILLYLALKDRRTLTATTLAGLTWCAGYAAVCYSCFGTPTPPSVYEPDPIDGHDILNRLAWLLISPSRGLLVYCPYLLVFGGLLLAYRRTLRETGLLFPAGLSCAAYLAVFSGYNGWHAGSSYGPRYFSDLVPWFVLVGAMVLNAMANTEVSRVRRVLEVLLLMGSFAWAIWVHGRGANSPEAWEWNYLSIPNGQEASVKDWSHPQFLAGITFVVKPDGTPQDLP